MSLILFLPYFDIGNNKTTSILGYRHTQKVKEFEDIVVGVFTMLNAAVQYKNYFYITVRYSQNKNFFMKSEMSTVINNTYSKNLNF